MSIVKKKQYRERGKEDQSRFTEKKGECLPSKTVSERMTFLEQDKDVKKPAESVDGRKGGAILN